jgi:hypothetical protein
MVHSYYSALYRCIFVCTIMNKVVGLHSGKVVMTAENSVLANPRVQYRNITLLHISRHTGISYNTSMCPKSDFICHSIYRLYAGYF